MHSQHIQKLNSLSAHIKQISQSSNVADHIELCLQTLLHLHKGKCHDQQFISASHLPLLYRYLTTLPKFTTPQPKHQLQYDAVKGLVKFLAGSEEPEILTSFLRSQFACLKNREKLSWRFIFDHVDDLKSSNNKHYSIQMKKLLEKFSNGNPVEYFLRTYPEVLDGKIINHKIMKDLMSLCNHILKLRRERRSNGHLLNFRRSIIACLVTTHTKKQLRKAGWEIDNKAYQSCKRKREDDDMFLNVDPDMTSGRKAISDELKTEIVKL